MKMTSNSNESTLSIYCINNHKPVIIKYDKKYHFNFWIHWLLQVYNPRSFTLPKFWTVCDTMHSILPYVSAKEHTKHCHMAKLISQIPHLYYHSYISEIFLSSLRDRTVTFPSRKSWRVRAGEDNLVTVLHTAESQLWRWLTTEL